MWASNQNGQRESSISSCIQCTDSLRDESGEKKKKICSIVRRGKHETGQKQDKPTFLPPSFDTCEESLRRSLGVKYWRHRHADLRSDAQNPCESLVWRFICHLSTEKSQENPIHKAHQLASLPQNKMKMKD